LVLFGSGETQASSGKAHEAVARSLETTPEIAILETPAGFELNSDRVAGAVADFLARRLQNYQPRLSVIPARKRNTALSPDDPQLLEPMLRANWIFLGPGSPTYAVRQLKDSLALHYMAARHRMGAAVMLASAATLAFSAYTLPVYEIYKVGEEIHWKPGLDFFAAYGLSLVIIPHWNNTDGGAELDTSHCYMGLARFNPLAAMLPAGTTILGLDEHTALIIDLQAGVCQVMGAGGVTIIRDGDERRFAAGESFPAERLGDWRLPVGGEGIPAAAWQAAMQAALAIPERVEAGPDEKVISLVSQRQQARLERNWQQADQLRQKIYELGWQVLDTPEGPQLARR
jgi:hypothetical protein